MLLSPPTLRACPCLALDREGTFYESSIRVPLLVSLPWHEGMQARCDLVSLSDITATVLCLAGHSVPDYMDAVPLPGLDLSSHLPRDCIIGMTQSGWMVYDGEWRLSKYATGEALLFHIKADPQEQHNLFHDPSHMDIRDSLDARLTQAIMHSMREANFDRRVYTQDLSQYPWFGREGWQRPYPRSLQDR